MAGHLIEGATDNADNLRQLAGEAGALWLDPAALARHPSLAVRLRRSILMRCYGGDYHVGTEDDARLIAQVASGQEQILVWGAAHDIAAVSDLVHRQTPPDEIDLEALAMGTHTTMPGASLYGRGYLEVARTGSVQHQTGSTALAAIRWDLARVLTRRDPLRPFHTIACLPRNRASAPGIPGGAAIHRLHTRSLGTSHWGVAPFYVMAGGTVEVLDYREISVNADAVPAAFAQHRPIYTADTCTAGLIRDLCHLNGFDPPIRSAIAHVPVPDAPIEFPPRDHTADRFAPRVVMIDNDCGGEGVRRAVQPAGEACTVAICDLEDPRSVAVQAALLAAGFQLTYVSPPKLLRHPRSPARRHPMRGGFTCVRSSGAFALPYYLSGGPMTPTEAALVQRYRTMFHNGGGDHGA